MNEATHLITEVIKGEYMKKYGIKIRLTATMSREQYPQSK